MNEEKDLDVEQIFDLDYDEQLDFFDEELYPHKDEFGNRKTTNAENQTTSFDLEDFVTDFDDDDEQVTDDWQTEDTAVEKINIYQEHQANIDKIKKTNNKSTALKMKKDDVIISPQELNRKVKQLKPQSTLPVFMYAGNTLALLSLFYFIVFSINVLNNVPQLALSYGLCFIVSLSLYIVGEFKLRRMTSGVYIDNIKNTKALITNTKKIKYNYTIMQVILILLLAPFGLIGLILILVICNKQPERFKMKAKGYNIYYGYYGPNKKFIFSEMDNNKWNNDNELVVYEDNHVIIVNRV